MEAQDLEFLRQSSLFEPEWYCRTYPDVREAGIDPALHFLRYGWVLGRDPGPEFDVKFYTERYPDIAGSGVNPLLHYLWQGQAEGRLPTPAAEKVRVGMEQVRKLQAELWGGLAEQAEHALQTLCDTPTLPEQVRFEAGCQLAAWFDHSGDEDRALRCLERMGGMSFTYSHSAARLIPMSVIYARRGIDHAARAALTRIRPGDLEADKRIALANLDPSDRRLERVNTLYKARGLAPVEVLDAGRSLGLDNLTTQTLPPSAETAELGIVSVILPAFNAAKYIETALRGLLAQTHQNLEIIVVDDASTDDTFDTVSRLAEADPRIIPLRQKENAGAYAARNRGLSVASGEYVTTHDADDWSHPQKIATQLAELAASPDLMGVITHWVRVRAPLTFTTNWRLSPSYLQWSHSSLLVRRQVMKRLGGWDEVRVSADMEFIWRVEAAFGQGSVRRILPDIPMAFALDDGSSLTRNPETHIQTSYHGLRHYYREISRYWHRLAPQGLSPEQEALKRAMLPAAMIPNAAFSNQLDLLIETDCSDPDALAQVQQMVHEVPTDRQIGITHVPNPDFTDRRCGYAIELHDMFFEVIQKDNVTIACPVSQYQATRTLSV
ncbi:glycosyltransferase family 2 protein [Lutimaribacter marinistellae]|uniref:Glycosyltransferase family 2 protein n=1 Tax=Lutimaribacter marinistellae TaxID=1820329 RepID=A0ABV7TBA9_9RHOB